MISFPNIKILSNEENINPEIPREIRREPKDFDPVVHSKPEDLVVLSIDPVLHSKQEDVVVLSVDPVALSSLKTSKRCSSESDNELWEKRKKRTNDINKNGNKNAFPQTQTIISESNNNDSSIDNNIDNNCTSIDNKGNVLASLLHQEHGNDCSNSTQTIIFANNNKEQTTAVAIILLIAITTITTLLFLD